MVGEQITMIWLKCRPDGIYMFEALRDLTKPLKTTRIQKRTPLAGNFGQFLGQLKQLFADKGVAHQPDAKIMCELLAYVRETLLAQVKHVSILSRAEEQAMSMRQLLLHLCSELRDILWDSLMALSKTTMPTELDELAQKDLREALSIVKQNKENCWETLRRVFWDSVLPKLFDDPWFLDELCQMLDRVERIEWCLDHFKPILHGDYSFYMIDMQSVKLTTEMLDFFEYMKKAYKKWNDEFLNYLLHLKLTLFQKFGSFKHRLEARPIYFHYSWIEYPVATRRASNFFCPEYHDSGREWRENCENKVLNFFCIF